MCYKFAEDKISWNEAQTNCESENGHLATVNSRYVSLVVPFFNFYFIFCILGFRVFLRTITNIFTFSLKPILTWI